MSDHELRLEALRALELATTGNFKGQEELAQRQRRSNDDHLGIIRAAVSRSYTVAPPATSLKANRS